MPATDTTRCPICDWPLAESADKGCVPGNCSYRPDTGSPEDLRIRARRAALAKTAAETKTPAPETGWLVERYINNRLHYWNAGSGMNGRTDGFTSDANDAVRFCREEDASIVLYRVCDGQGRVAQHQWVARPNSGGQ